MPNSLMSVSDLIDAAFGEYDQNVVNFNLLQTILIILAKQLRLLQRRVEIDYDLGTIRTTSTISVTELKLQATVPKRKKKNIEKNVENSKNRRANSREEAEKTPTPMASLDSMELQYEKLLVVERVPADEKDNESSQDTQAVQLSVVTQDQFDNLAKIVEELQKKFGSIPKANLPDNVQLMQDLRKGASLTDAMAALQLSARLESAEKTLEQMISLITDVAIQKGIDLTKDNEIDENETKAIDERDSSQLIQESRKSTLRKHSKKDKSTYDTVKKIPKETTEGASEEVDESLLQAQKDRITMLELKEAMKGLYDSLMKSVTNVTSKVTSNAEDALNLAHILGNTNDHI